MFNFLKREKNWYVFQNSFGDVYAVEPEYDDYKLTQEQLRKNNSQWILAKTKEEAIIKYYELYT